MSHIHIHQKALLVIFANFCSLNIPIMVDFKLIRTLPNEQLGSDDHTKRRRFNPWVKKILWRRVWQPTSIVLPGASSWTDEPGGLQSIG